MQLEKFLLEKKTTLETIIESAKEKEKILPQDILILVGSLSEGLGNIKSDFDLILLTSRPKEEVADKELISWVSGKCVVDMEVKSLAEIDSQMTEFIAWTQQDWSLTFASKFSTTDRKMLHRYLAAKVLQHDKQTPASTFISYGKDELARLKLHCARHTARSIQVDMIGNCSEEDYYSLVYASNELLGHAVDALTAGYKLTNATLKWRSRLLDQLPDCGIVNLNSRFASFNATELVWDLSVFPKKLNKASALEHAHKVVYFCRYLFLWAELRLVYPNMYDSLIIPHWKNREESDNSMVLPNLEMDVDFIIDENQITVARLNEFGEVITLDSTEFSLLMLFDGQTTYMQAINSVFDESTIEHGKIILDQLLEASRKINILV